MSTGGHLVVKLLANPQEEGRVVTGWASTADLDRQSDIVVPEGMRVTLPISLLEAHDHRSVIGSVFEAKAHAKGIRIKARLVEGVSAVTDIWLKIQQRAITSFSIGFQGLKSEPLPNGGRRWVAWDFLECSVVAVPANEHARIESFSNAKHLPTEAKVIPRSDDPRVLSREQKDDIRSIVKNNFANHGKDPVKLAQVIELQMLARMTVLKNRLNALEARIASDYLKENDSESSYAWYKFTIPEGADEPLEPMQFPWWILPAVNGRHACTAAIPKDVSQRLCDVFNGVEVQKQWTAPLDWSQFDQTHWWPGARHVQLIALAEKAAANRDAERLEARLTALERVRH